MTEQAGPAPALSSAFGILGVSAAMQPVLRLIEEAASNGRPVLICGEAGTGRRRIARSIHALAGCRPETFVQVDCAVQGDGDLEATLFGRPSGGGGTRAAARQNESLSSGSVVWRARAGTLYVANVVEAPSSVQGRLARVLRDRELIAPDGSRAPLDCRLIACVEPDYKDALRDGRFRRDLCARLASIVIDVPPLRERREEIPALAAFFLDQYAREAGAAPKRLTESAAMLLEALPWQGNGGELRGLVESLAQWVKRDTIELADVLARVRLDPNARSVAVGGTLRTARQRFEREYIDAVLRKYGGRIRAAASALGIQRTNLYRKMRALGLSRRRYTAADARPEAATYPFENGGGALWRHR